MYNIEYQIQQMERKVNRAEGDRSEEEKAIFQERIRALQEELDAATGKCKMLENQVSCDCLVFRRLFVCTRACVDFFLAHLFLLLFAVVEEIIL